jgi:hypothetical protein
LATDQSAEIIASGQEAALSHIWAFEVENNELSMYNVIIYC